MIVASLIYALVVAKSTSVPKLVNILLKSVMIVLNVWNSKNTNLSETGISKAQESLSTTTWHIWKSSSILIFLILI